MVGNMDITLPEKATSEAVHFLRQLFGSVAEVSEFLGDKVRYIRWKSAVKRIEAANEFAKTAGIHPKEVPLKFLIPFLEKASLEDDESELTDMWAKLLANASGGFNWKQAIYPNILSEIGCREAQLLRGLVNSTSQVFSDGKEKDGRLSGNVLLVPDAEADMGIDAIVRELTKIRTPERRAKVKDHYVEELLKIIKRPSGLTNCEISFVRLHFVENARVRSDYFFRENEFEFEGSCVILERQGLIMRKRKLHEVNGRPAVEIAWVKATQLGFDLIATCDHVPPQKIVLTRTVSAFGPSISPRKKSKKKCTERVIA